MCSWNGFLIPSFKQDNTFLAMNLFVVLFPKYTQHLRISLVRFWCFFALWLRSEKWGYMESPNFSSELKVQEIPQGRKLRHIFWVRKGSKLVRRHKNYIPHKYHENLLMDSFTHLDKKYPHILFLGKKYHHFNIHLAKLTVILLHSEF